MTRRGMDSLGAVAGERTGDSALCRVPSDSAKGPQGSEMKGYQAGQFIAKKLPRKWWKRVCTASKTEGAGLYGGPRKTDHYSHR